MNGNWTELYDLIHSMNPSEKGYFRKFVGGYGEATDKVYDFLFTLLDKQSMLDEDKIVAIVTINSIENMGLKVGASVDVIIKASDIMIGK